MTPFEDLIHGLGNKMGITLHPDSNQSCLINFAHDNLSIQIDLDREGDQILIGSQLGTLTPGVYRENILTQAMRVNGTSIVPRGILAYSEKNDALILFQFFSIKTLDVEKLYNFIQLFQEHAKVWKQAIEKGEIPTIEEEEKAPATSSENRIFGLNP